MMEKSTVISSVLTNMLTDASTQAVERQRPETPSTQITRDGTCSRPLSRQAVPEWMSHAFEIVTPRIDPASRQSKRETPSQTPLGGNKGTSQSSYSRRSDAIKHHASDGTHKVKPKVSTSGVPTPKASFTTRIATPKTKVVANGKVKAIPKKKVVREEDLISCSSNASIGDPDELFLDDPPPIATSDTRDAASASKISEEKKEKEIPILQVGTMAATSSASAPSNGAQDTIQNEKIVPPLKALGSARRPLLSHRGSARRQKGQGKGSARLPKTITNFGSNMDLTMSSIVQSVHRRLQEEQKDLDPIILLPSKEEREAIAATMIVKDAVEQEDIRNESPRTPPITSPTNGHVPATGSNFNPSQRIIPSSEKVVHKMGPIPPPPEAEFFRPLTHRASPKASLKRPMSACGPRTPALDVVEGVPLLNFNCPAQMNLESALLLKDSRNNIIPRYNTMTPAAARYRSHQSWSQFVPRDYRHRFNLGLTSSSTSSTLAPTSTIPSGRETPATVEANEGGSQTGPMTLAQQVMAMRPATAPGLGCGTIPDTINEECIPTRPDAIDEKLNIGTVSTNASQDGSCQPDSPYDFSVAPRHW